MHKFRFNSLFLSMLFAGIFIFSSCQSNHNKLSRLLNKDSLFSQSFQIDNSKDTLLHTANGALIKIAAGSFKQDKVALEVKEAYSIPQMILGGLTTSSDGKPLSSGGMIYLHAKGEEQLKKPIAVSVPTNFYDEKMQVYKGEEKDGKVNWVDPKPLEKDSISAYLENGKKLFQSSCASCHAYDKIFSGPAMKGIDQRGPWKSRTELINFTHAPAAYIPSTCYTKELLKQYGQIMPNFEGSAESLNAIYDYLKNEDLRNGVETIQNTDNCFDSCLVYDSIIRARYPGYYQLKNKKKNLVEDNGDRINFTMSFSEMPADTNGNLQDSLPLSPPPDKVTPEHYTSLYYTFNINTLDWYNIDQLLNYANTEVELTVEATGKYDKDLSYFIVVPQFRIFYEGGKLDKGNNLYGFYTKDGKIPLPPGTDVIVFAVGEAEEQIVFGYQRFTANGDLNIRFEPALVSKRKFNKQVLSFGLTDASIKAQDSKNATEIRKIDSKLKKQEADLEMYRPKNCSCNCEENDSTSESAFANVIDTTYN